MLAHRFLCFMPSPAISCHGESKPQHLGRIRVKSRFKFTFWLVWSWVWIPGWDPVWGQVTVGSGLQSIYVSTWKGS